MRFLYGFLIVLAATVAGALAPFLFAESLRNSLSTSIVCDVVSKATKSGILTADSRKRLLETVVASSDVDDKSKTAAGRVKEGC